MIAIPSDTKHKIIASAARLFYENGYEKTTLRMIGEQVGIAHVSILNYFDSKIEIAAKTFGDYLTGLQKKCGELIDAMPPDVLDEEEGFQTTWWLLWWLMHFKLLYDNPSFRKFYISFNKEGPLVLTQAVHSITTEELKRTYIMYPNVDIFISRSLLTAIDVNLVNLMDLNVIDYVKAARIMMRQQAAIEDRKIKFNLNEADIALFAKTYISGIKIDILNDFLLPRNE